MTELRPTARPAELPALTVLRGIAAWWIVAYHFREALLLPPGWADRVLERGYLAVDIFFVLSGFVIALNYLDRVNPASPRSILLFLGQRLARIYPLHIALLVAYLSVPALYALSGKPPPPFYSPRDWLLHATLLQIWGSTALTWNVPDWSISTELFLYVLFLPLCPLLRMVTRRRFAAAVLAMTAIALLGVLYAHWGTDSLNTELLRRAPVRGGLEFTAGALCFAIVSGRALGTAWSIALGLAGAAGLAASLAGYVPETFGVPAASCLIILALSTRCAWTRAAAAVPGLHWLGEVSYSTYLVHYLIRVWIKLAAVGPDGATPVHFLLYLAAVLSASAVLHPMLELPAQRAIKAWLAARLKQNPIRGHHLT